MLLKNKIAGLLLLSLVLFTAFSLRFYGINWDQHCCLHPDERAIVMFTLPLSLPLTLEDFLSIQSPLNPHFFAYGNFPLYLLKNLSVFMKNLDPQFAAYDGINILGRAISILADMGILVLIFKITKNIFNKKVGLLALLFYAFSVFPIQASHFYAVDVLLTFFILLTIYRLIIFYQRPVLLNAIKIGLCYGFALATKISALPLIAAVTSALTIDFLLIFIKAPHKINLWLPHFPILIKSLFVEGLLMAIVTSATFLILQPYSLIDYSNFIKQNLYQSEMTRNAYVFPYTLVYVGKIPYFYELKNVFLWGLGPIISVFSFLGFLYYLATFFKQEKRGVISKELVFFTFFFVYFVVVGKFAVGFMRYMLPLYPYFAIFSGLSAYQLIIFSRKFLGVKATYVFSLIALLLVVFWPLSFMAIYQKPNTRIQATNWINQNISPNKVLAVEHWDDRVPMWGSEKYKFNELTLYDQPDNQSKWEILNTKLKNSDYIILASNRLYVPLQRLSDCTKYKICYPLASQYYKKLFSGDLPFRKVAEFTSYPIIPILNIKIEDQSADESFTVYDHPKIIIFKRYSALSLEKP